LTTLLIANAIVLVAAFVQGAAGIGFAMIVVPLLALTDLAYVPGPALIALLALAVLMAVHGRGHVQWRDFLSLLPGLAAGSVFGAWLLDVIPPAWLGALLGAVILLGVAAIASGVRARLAAPQLLVGGTVAGAMGTIAGIHGPPLAILYASAPLERARAMIALAFVLAAILSLAALAALGRVGPADLNRGLWLLPGLLLGLALARFAIGRLPARWLRVGMLAISGASGVLLILRSVL
jgi:uncharacterized membrane protein YfcA